MLVGLPLLNHSPLVLNAEQGSGIEMNRILFQRTHYRRDVPGVPSAGVPLWAFGRK